MLKDNNRMMGRFQVSTSKERAYLNKAYPKLTASIMIAMKEEQLRISRIKT